MLKYVLLLAFVGYAAASICPGGQSQCPGTETCCELSSGGYGCCKFTKATCCSDHEHCCPENYKCDLSNGTCASGIPLNDGSLHILPMAKQLDALPYVMTDQDKAVAAAENHHEEEPRRHHHHEHPQPEGEQRQHERRNDE
eukprot:scpid13620/ scgid6628/ Granulins; Proepithelin; Acrogranin; Paragranulin; Granulin-1; Granulin G; Granulin-2; Granulin F; Granulin-3; Granulin B; Granulin-4; Granulin A; Granulin-5; Granulin C; Granulin-6; Granulin D; Granulin-7; Granulin E